MYLKDWLRKPKKKLLRLRKQKRKKQEVVEAPVEEKPVNVSKKSKKNYKPRKKKVEE